MEDNYYSAENKLEQYIEENYEKEPITIRVLTGEDVYLDNSHRPKNDFMYCSIVRTIAFINQYNKAEKEMMVLLG